MCDHTTTKRNRFGDRICVECSAVCEMCVRCDNTFEKTENYTEFCPTCDEIVLAEEDADEDYVDDEEDYDCENDEKKLEPYNPLLIILRSVENAKKKIKYSFPPPSDFHKEIEDINTEVIKIVRICQHDPQNNLFLVEREDGYASWEELQTIQNTPVYKEWKMKK